MSFWNGMKRAFGFSPEEDDEDGEYDPTLPTYAVDKSSTEKPDEHTDNNASSHSEDKTTVSSVATDVNPITPTMADNELPTDLFDAVIKLFNEQQPEFVRVSLSSEAQRKYIIGAISDSLKSRIKTAVNPIPPQQAWNEERIRLTRRIQQLESGGSDIETLRQENRKLQLSVDRQKRALLDRINDLETQVARQNDEKEQIYTKKKFPVDTAKLDKANSRIAELEEQCKAIEEQRKALEEQCSVLTSQREQFNKQLQEKDAVVQQLQAKIQVSDVLINDLRNENASSRNELEKIQEEQDVAIAHIQQQIDGFEQLKARKDAKIAQSTKKINELTEENESLRNTIENNLYNQANNERELREEIKNLRSRLEKTEAAAAASTDNDDTISEPKLSRRRGRPKKVRIDSSLDNTDWFASGKKDDPDFGYHEPPRRPVNDNEAQLTLF